MRHGGSRTTLELTSGGISWHKEIPSIRPSLWRDSMLAKSRRLLGNLRLWALIAGLSGLVVGREDYWLSLKASRRVGSPLASRGEAA